MRSPESIVSDVHLRMSVRYAAARDLIEKGTTCRKARRENKFFIIQKLGGSHKKGTKGRKDYVVFPDNTKAIF